jgi:uncharacterized protein YjbI with pentapeptide repeats
LHEATLRRADLSDADLTDAHGLLGVQLGGADVGAAKLPETVGHFEALLHLEAVTEIARPIFILTLLVSLFTFATMNATTDLSLLTNAPSEILPDVNTPIPTVGFYWGAPILLFSLYVYLHLYVGNLWEDLDSLPATFPDGTPLHSKVYPWLLVRLMARHVSGRRAMLGKDMFIMRATVNKFFVFLVWWLVPLTLLMFWGRYLPTHDWYGTGLHIVLLAIAIGTGGRGLRSYGPWRKAMTAPEESLSARLSWLNNDKSIALVIGVLLCGLSYGAFHGSCPDPDKSGFTQISSWIPRLFQVFWYSPYASFQGLEASTKPETWTGEITSVKGVDFGEKDLRCTDMSGSFLVNADLHKANLEGANLSGEVDLRNANLSEANLNQADLTSANLERADLKDAKLQGSILDAAILMDADVERADLRRASLAAAWLHRADLTEADLRAADLRAAKLPGATLCLADLRQAKLVGANLVGANLRGADLEGADLSDANLKWAKFGRCASRTGSIRSRETNLQRAILRGTRLQNSGLKGTRLEGAKFGMGSEFCLQGTDIRGANLAFARGVTQQQLDQSCGDVNTQLPFGLRVKSCPGNC